MYIRDDDVAEILKKRINELENIFNGHIYENGQPQKIVAELRVIQEMLEESVSLPQPIINVGCVE